MDGAPVVVMLDGIGSQIRRGMRNNDGAPGSISWTCAV